MMDAVNTVGRVALTVGLAMAVAFVGSFCREAYRDWRRGWRPWRGDPPYDYERDGL